MSLRKCSQKASPPQKQDPFAASDGWNKVQERTQEVRVVVLGQRAQVYRRGVGIKYLRLGQSSISEN